MQLTYLGHSSFKIKAKNGVVVTDPFAPSVGFKMPAVSAEIVTVSHEHEDHNYIQAVEGKPLIIRGPGEYERAEISVIGLPTWHDNRKGEERGGNTVYLITVEDLVVCHLGDLGHRLSAKLIEEIGGIDILMLPVGGHFTIGPKRAAEVVGMVEPKLVIPMHYRTERHASTFNKLFPVTAFLAEMGAEAKRADKLTVSKSSLGEELEVVVFD